MVQNALSLQPPIAQWSPHCRVKAVTYALPTIWKQRYQHNYWPAPHRLLRTAVTRNLSLPIQWLKLVHGACVLNVSHSNTISRQAHTLTSRACFIPKADGLCTELKGLGCAVTTGDCLPVALTDSHGTWVSMLHAGWRGLLCNIIAQGVKRSSQPTSSLKAWIGPHICYKCYEVSEDLVERFLKVNLAYRQFFEKKGTRLTLNLTRLAIWQLQALGITDVTTANNCTYCNTSLYSYRRDGVSSIAGNISLIYRC